MQKDKNILFFYDRGIYFVQLLSGNGLDRVKKGFWNPIGTPYPFLILR